MKKIILGVLFGLFFVSSSVFAVDSYNSEQAQYQSILSALSNLSAQIPVLRNQNKITAQQEGSFLTIITNLMSSVIARISPNPVDNSTKLNISPFIKSIDKSSGSIGTVVTLKGVDLTGFEGDLDAWIENSAGEVGYLPGIYSGQRKTDRIVVKIPERACKQNNSYSGNPCTSYLNITPGMYKLYTNPFGKKSNVVTFEVVKSVLGNIQISILNGGLFDSTLLAQVEVDVYLGNKKIDSKSTSNGGVVFENLVVGSYDLHFKAKGFQDFRKSFFVNAGINNLSVALQSLSLNVAQRPFISSIQSVTNIPGTIDANKKAFIYGLGLNGDLIIKLGMKEPKIIKVTNKSDSSVEFMVPDQTLSSVVSVSVTGSSGLVSDYYEVKINSQYR